MSAESPLLRIHDLPLASSLPGELRGQVLYTKAVLVEYAEPGATAGKGGQDVQPPPPPQPQQHGAGNRRAGAAKGTAPAGGFNFSKALQGGLSGAGSSVTSRGDGKFAGGQNIAVSDTSRAKFVHLGPDALSPANAEATLEQLDQLQQREGRGNVVDLKALSSLVSGTSATPPGGRGAVLNLRSNQQQHAEALVAAGNILYDISDDVAMPAAVPVAATTPGQPHASSKASSSACVPEYTIRKVLGSARPGPSNAEQQSPQLEVSVLLPGVSGPGEVDVWLDSGLLRVTVPGRYHLELRLPVLEDTSRAKWSKAKHKLTLTLVQAT
ncbi:hypothetical protein TSOC_007644 [Tetrabaena socialis]|uniref:PIH1D1/2/3 CS-like domain-containing protein n=1 Tax=Tetrabaena socialis TaxID=47790 RepID=A0A2J8A0J2_9CHLO|nr:hypothetical protein TSOC_007644 [Tetrabaena socialis]|eukprot:PNH06037.1 hypothetical protein TSOC_007644 [Tetrabaena socialis]